MDAPPALQGRPSQKFRDGTAKGNVVFRQSFFVTQLAHILSSARTLVARFPISFGRRALFLAPVLLGAFPASELALGMHRSRRKDFGLEALVCRCECFGFKYAGKVLKSALSNSKCRALGLLEELAIRNMRTDGSAKVPRTDFC